MTPSVPLRSSADQARQSLWRCDGLPRWPVATPAVRQTSSGTFVVYRPLALRVQLSRCGTVPIALVRSDDSAACGVFALALAAESGDQLDHGVKRGFERFSVAFDL